MKLTIILPIMALAVSASARNVHVVGDLKAREIDPATMDPTKLSILSVLKTAVPTLTGTELALPTGNRIGDFSAQWYQDLPPDVLMLLAQMYPTTQTSETAAPATSTSDAATAPTATAASTSNGTQSTTTGTSAVSNPVVSNSAISTGDHSTSKPSKPSSSQPASSAGAKNTVSTGSWSVPVGLSVAALFCLLA